LDSFFPGGKSSAALLGNHFNDNTLPRNRIDVDIESEDEASDLLEPSKKEMLKEEITTVVGAVLAKQKCWERTACIVGKRTKAFVAKDVVFMYVKRWNERGIGTKTQILNQYYK
jgi:hypothetical protein